MERYVSIVLGSYNRLDFLKIAISSIRTEINLLSFSIEIIVVDGGSSDGSLEWLLEQKDIITIVQHNRGSWRGKKIYRRSWGYFMNLAFKCAQGKYICMVSDDCLLIPGALRNGSSQFDEALARGEKVGAVAFYWRQWPKEEVYRLGNPMGTNMYVNHGLYLNQAVRDIGYIDEDSYEFYFADIDLCFRLKQEGYVVIDAQNSFVEHYPYANLSVRQSNHARESKDFKTFLDRWQRVYPQLTNHNISDKKKKKFIDPAYTIEKYKGLHEQNLSDNKSYFRRPSKAKQYLSGMKWNIKKLLRNAKDRLSKN